MTHEGDDDFENVTSAFSRDGTGSTAPTVEPSWDGPGVVLRPRSRVTPARNLKGQSIKRMGMYDYWRSIVADYVIERGGVAEVPRGIFTKHINELRPYSDVAIRNAFRRFADDVKGGRVDVHNKTAWFVFYGRRKQYVRMTDVVGISETPLPLPRLFSDRKERPPGDRGAEP